MAYQAAWLSDLNTEDIHFVKKFMLASGSLKEVAEAYRVSYPTVRLRLARPYPAASVFYGGRCVYGV